MAAWLRQTWQDLVEELFDKQGLDTVFSHARNVMTSALVIAAGMYAAHHFDALGVNGPWSPQVAGYGVAALGVMLLGLNLFDGLRRLARRKHHVVLRLAAIFVYVVLSIRLTQVIVYFRSAA
ncbi:hypothetical protein [Piscinibacter sp. XHJ-5]|uniref:hypothetical protein n=1 Tax=Piscinibacter sp. XHJ-5 TaxID=3037797 RepID=UPI0024536CFA|nr:hypothetical protein [Piscinibacter sp. XHJ-5]